MTIDDFPKVKRYVEAAVTEQGGVLDRIDVAALPDDMIEVTAFDSAGLRYGPMSTTRRHALNGAWSWWPAKGE